MDRKTGPAKARNKIPIGTLIKGLEAPKETMRRLRPLGAEHFGADLVGCFAGRLPGASVPASMEQWKRTFSPLAEKAEKRKVRIAFENCRMGDTWKTGKWNIAINPDAWDLMFRTIPSPALGRILFSRQRRHRLGGRFFAAAGSRI
jgi:sugar phosphate isomerase/epimerase